jgi:hypothetical protein
METMSIDETLKRVMKHYPASPFMTADVLRLYEAEGYDITDRRVCNSVSRHLCVLYKQNYLKVIDTVNTYGGNKRVFMVRQ